MLTSFGPQSVNYATVRPATNPQVSGGIDTWFQDCTAAGASDGTIVTASWLNMVTANLRKAVNDSGIALDDSDSMLYDAIAAISADVYTASKGVQRVGNDIRLAVGSNTLPVMTA